MTRALSRPRISSEFWNIRHYSHEFIDSQDERSPQRWGRRQVNGRFFCGIKRARNQKGPEPKDHIARCDYLFAFAGLAALAVLATVFAAV